ncbi:intein/RHS repeat-associated protein [Plasticicumulans lactativorans]|uniref:Intein/RHS repeat-associated protein n=2 Tax=Plasticicumulans lactativorans TaxID=1133106 RepID=A0A4R2L660_9GAMM|nr:intein/RHS repeat-associated protein [Plasticicumulans lactativorans]
MAYDAAGNLLASTDVLGHVTAYAYDALDRRVGVTAPDPDGGGPLAAPVTRYAFDAADNLVAITDPLGHVTAYAYDALNRRVRSTDALGQLSETVYDAVGNVIATIDPLSQRTRYVFDGLDRRIGVEQPDPDGAGGPAQPLLTTFGYDALGNLTAVTDPLGHTSARHYDALNRVVRETDAAGNDTAYAYDALGNVTALTDASGNATRSTYDRLSRLVAQTDPLGAVRSYAYDAVGNRVRTVDALGRVTEFTFDALDRNTAETWRNADGSVARVIERSFDGMGRLLTVRDPDARYALGYDALGRMTRIDNAGSPGLVPVVLDYAYDAAGNLREVATTIAGNADWRTRYTVDALNRVIAIEQSGGQALRKRVEFDYDAAGHNVATRRYDATGSGADLSTTTAWDAAGRLTAITHSNAAGTALASYHYLWDAASRLVGVDSTDGSARFGYDDRDQLIAADFSYQADQSFSYDASGNPSGAGTTVGTGNRITEDGSYRYAYDAEGNRIRRTEIATGAVTEYTWDHRNRLVGVVQRDAGGHVTAWQTLRYDAFDWKVATTTDADGDGAQAASRLLYVHDRDDVAMLFDGAQQLRETFLHGDGMDAVLAEQRGGELRWSLTDLQHTVRDVADADGVVRDHLRYDSFGVVTGHSDAAAAPRFGYTGRELDTLTGLLDYRARWYDPNLRQFVSVDPIGFAAGDANLYRYVANRPLDRVDPSGHETATAWVDKAMDYVIPGRALIPSGSQAGPWEGLARDLTNPLLLAQQAAGGLIGVAGSVVVPLAELAKGIAHLATGGLGDLAYDAYENVQQRYQAACGDTAKVIWGLVSDAAGAVAKLPAAVKSLPGVAKQAAGEWWNDVERRVLRGDDFGAAAKIGFAVGTAAQVVEGGAGIARAGVRVVAEITTEAARLVRSGVGAAMSVGRVLKAEAAAVEVASQALTAAEVAARAARAERLIEAARLEKVATAASAAKKDITLWRGVYLTDEQAAVMAADLAEGRPILSNATRNGFSAEQQAQWRREAIEWAERQSGDRAWLKGASNEEKYAAYHVEGSGPDTQGISFTADRKTAEEWAVRFNKGEGKKPYLLRVDVEVPGPNVVRQRGASYIGEFETTLLGDTAQSRGALYELSGTRDTIHGGTTYRKVAPALREAGAELGATSAKAGDVLGPGLLNNGPECIELVGGHVPKSPPVGVCFVEGTRVVVAGAGGALTTRPIEALEPGDQVLAADPDGDARGFARVVHVFRRSTRSLRVLQLAGQALRTTDEHPFWVVGRGWTRAGAIVAGDELLCVRGSRARVDASEAVTVEPTAVCNIEVEGYHSYFVSPLDDTDGAVLVHNADECSWFVSFQGVGPLSEADAAAGAALQLDVGAGQAWRGVMPEVGLVDATRVDPAILQAADLGTYGRAGMQFHEYNSAETAFGMRFGFDPVRMQPSWVEFNLSGAEGLALPERTGFRLEGTIPRTQQIPSSAYTNTVYERGHLAPRELAGTYHEAVRDLDVMSNVSPMVGRGSTGLNQGQWRQLEVWTNAQAEQRAATGGVRVRIDVAFEPPPSGATGPFSGGIPQSYTRTVRDQAGNLVDVRSVPNRPGTPLLALPTATGAAPAVAAASLATSWSAALALGEQALQLWGAQLGGGAGGQVPHLRFALADLPDGELGAATITQLDADGRPSEGRIVLDWNGDGHGWFVDATPLDASEFAAADGPAAGRYDLFSVIAHEVGHTLGFVHGYDGYDRHLALAADGTLSFAAPGVHAALDADGNHLAGAHADDLMADRLGVGERRLPSVIAAQIILAARTAAAAGAPAAVAIGPTALAAPGVRNGGFDVADPAAGGYGWTTAGAAGVHDGQGVLDEDSTLASRFTQSLAIPAGARQLRFTLVGAAFDAPGSGPQDAFEVALLDAQTHASLAGGLELPGTDALFNLQADGTVYHAAGVSALAQADGTRRVSIDVSALPAGQAAVLYFDLVGFGARGSRVVIDDVHFTLADDEPPPQAQDDQVTLAEDGSVTFDVRGNDSDPAGRPLTVTLVDAPQHGTLVLGPDGSLTFTPEQDFNGADAFTYRVGNGTLDSNVATVSLTVTPVNDAPAFVAGGDVTVAEDAGAVTLPGWAGAISAGPADEGGQALGFVVTAVGDPALFAVAPSVDADGTLRFTPAPDAHGSALITLALHDDGGSADGGVDTSAPQSFTLTLTPVNDTPTLAPLADVALHEGEVFALTLAAADADGDALSFTLLDAPDGATLDASGQLGWRAADGDADVAFTVEVSDAGGARATQSFVAHVANVAPTLAITGPAVARSGEPYTLALAHSDPGADTVGLWQVDWGDGTQTVVLGDTPTLSHVYAGPQAGVLIQAQAVDEDGTWTAPALTLDVQPPPAPPLQVTGFTPDASGFAVRFNQAFDAGVIELRDGAGGPADVSVQGAASGPVAGTLLIDADGRGLRFVKTGSALLPGDRFSVTLKSGPTAFTGAGGALDGNADGIAGDDYHIDFTVAPPPPLRLTLPDFMRGPGQAVDVPAARFGGLPVTLVSAGDVHRVSFEIRHDAALLAITDVHAGTGLPPGAVLSLDTSEPGRTRVTVDSPTPFAAGSVELVSLVAQVPFGAEYKRLHAIEIGAVNVNGQDTAFVGDAALHVVGYLGDTNASEAYDKDDVTLIQRMALRLDTGFAAWGALDPLIVADIDGNGVLTSIDAARVNQEQSGVDRPEIPPIPLRPTPAVLTASAAPAHVIVVDAAAPLAAPARVPVSAGDTLTLPLDLGALDPAQPLALIVDYPAPALTLLDVRNPADDGVRWRPHEATGAGRLRLDLIRSGVTHAAGRLLLDFRVGTPGTMALRITLRWQALDADGWPSPPTADPAAAAVDRLAATAAPRIAFGAAPLERFDEALPGAAGAWLGDWLAARPQPPRPWKLTLPGAAAGE